MSMLFLILSVVVLMLQASRACNEQNVQQLASTRLQSDEYAYGADAAYDAYGLTPNPWVSSYYQPAAHVPAGYANPYERRNPLNRQPNYNPFQKYFASNDYGNEATGRTFFRIFRCPTCPTCPTPEICPTCQTCPVIPAQTISLAPAAGECFSTGAPTILTTVSIAPCTRVSAAPKGTIDVTFSDPVILQTVIIGIVAVTPNTQIKLVCETIPTGGASVAKTQIGNIVASKLTIASGFLQIIASGAGAPPTAIKLSCSWESS